MKCFNDAKDQNNEAQDEKNYSKPFMTVDEACNYLDVSKSSMYKYMHRRIIPYFKPNNKKAYFKHEDLDDWVFRNKVVTEAELLERVDVRLKQIGEERSQITNGI